MSPTNRNIIFNSFIVGQTRPNSTANKLLLSAIGDIGKGRCFQISFANILPTYFSWYMGNFFIFEHPLFARLSTSRVGTPVRGACARKAGIHPMGCMFMGDQTFYLLCLRQNSYMQYVMRCSLAAHSAHTVSIYILRAFAHIPSPESAPLVFNISILRLWLKASFRLWCLNFNCTEIGEFCS